MIGLKPQNHQVQVRGSIIDVNIATSSKISDFNIDNAAKAITFSMDGESGTRGVTSVAIQDILVSPYTVAMDGNNIPFIVIEDEQSGDTMIQIAYSHSKHDFVITGTK